MEFEDRYRQFITAHAVPPPRTSGTPLHWDSVGAASRPRDLPPRTVPPARAAVLAPEQHLAREPMPPARTLPPQDRGTGSAVPTSPWVTEAARLTVYLAVALLRARRDPRDYGATGTLVWVCPAAPGAGGTSTGHPALLVHTVCAMDQEVYHELIPHVPADDPLSHHMALVLQTACDAEGVAGRLYATTLAEALAVHILRRYRACADPVHVGP